MKLYLPCRFIGKFQVWNRRSKERAARRTDAGLGKFFKESNIDHLTKMTSSIFQGSVLSMDSGFNVKSTDPVNSVQSRLIRHVPDFVWATEDMVKETPRVSQDTTFNQNITDIGHYDKRCSTLR